MRERLLIRMVILTENGIKNQSSNANQTVYLSKHTYALGKSKNLSVVYTTSYEKIVEYTKIPLALIRKPI